MKAAIVLSLLGKFILSCGVFFVPFILSIYWSSLQFLIAPNASTDNSWVDSWQILMLYTLFTALGIAILLFALSSINKAFKQETQHNGHILRLAILLPDILLLGLIPGGIVVVGYGSYLVGISVLVGIVLWIAFAVSVAVLDYRSSPDNPKAQRAKSIQD
jgi:magnesium-transporting ATPase (P-type)